jgi:hypothetical protein
VAETRRPRRWRARSEWLNGRDFGAQAIEKVQLAAGKWTLISLRRILILLRLTWISLRISFDIVAAGLDSRNARQTSAAPISFRAAAALIG